jgi:hypothetical protein
MIGEQPTNERPTRGEATSEQLTGEPWDDATLLSTGTELEYDDADESYRLRLDETEQSISVAVVGAVAAVAETDPLELRPLRESIDPDALDDLFARTRGGLTRESGRVEFSFPDYRVVVDATGVIEIHPSE